ncbi:hypothetical protein NDU88_005827 [Pleurodeles waltl]|uniref:Uncharacterized protein n=1 Tax=Pleurodeles waltl TaxID=8319 RepID=A0AAV7SN19_PLEWA|nr:hypothetical protein NDU88_005827 [Pleurodeles waltl]
MLQPRPERFSAAKSSGPSSEPRGAGHFRVLHRRPEAESAHVITAAIGFKRQGDLGADVLCSVVNGMWVEASLSVALVVEFYIMRIPGQKRLGGEKKKQRCESVQLMVDA